MLIAFSVAPGSAPPPSDTVPDGPDASAASSGSAASSSMVHAVADAARGVHGSGLPHRTDATPTTVEGSWDECMDVVRRACESVARHGDRVSLVLEADLRTTAGGTSGGRSSGGSDGVEREAARERVEGEPGRGQ